MSRTGCVTTNCQRIVPQHQSDQFPPMHSGVLQMRFIGGLNRPHSLFFRYQPNIRAVMEVSQSEVSISVGGASTCFLRQPCGQRLSLNLIANIEKSTHMSAFASEAKKNGPGSTPVLSLRYVQAWRLLEERRLTRPRCERTKYCSLLFPGQCWWSALACFCWRSREFFSCAADHKVRPMASKLLA